MGKTHPESLPLSRRHLLAGLAAAPLVALPAMVLALPARPAEAPDPAAQLQLRLLEARQLLDALRPGYWHVALDVPAGYALVMRSDTAWRGDSFMFPSKHGA